MNKAKLALTIVISLICRIVHAYDFKVDGIAYTVSGQTVTVARGSDGMDTIRIPEYVINNGRTYKVTEIGDNAFKHSYDYYGDDGRYKYIKHIIIPKTIYKIGKEAFSCEQDYHRQLTSVEIPPSLTDIGDKAFYRCDQLQSINLPEGLVNVGSEAFSKCKSLQTFTIPSTVQTFCALDGCTGLYQIINFSNIVVAAPHSNCIVYDKTNMLSITPKEVMYNGYLPTFEYTNNLPEYDATVNFSDIVKDAGSHTGSAHVNYINSESSIEIDIPFQYTITPAPLALTINNAKREYGESNPEFTYSINGFVSGESEANLDSKPTINCNAATSSSVGNYPIKASVSARNYYIKVNEGTLTITKVPLVIATENVSRAYGSTNPTFTATYIGLKNNETKPNFVKSISFSTSATISSPVSKYDIIASGGESNNYEFTQYLKGVLTIEKAPLTITAKSAAKYYFDENPEFSVSYSGFKNGDDASVLTALPQVSTDAKQNSDAGEYELSVSGCVCQNYEPKFVNGVFTILPRVLTIKANDAERVYGEKNPDFTYEYDGFINDENENVLMTKPILSTNATKTSDVGTYTINVSGAKAVNYKPIYKNGTLTINKASQQIVWEQDLEDLKLHDQVGLNAKASSGLEISYTFDDPSLVSLYNADDMLYMDCVKAGTTTICATQTGNKNYKSAVRVYKTMKIVDTNNPIQPGDALYMTIKQEGGKIIQKIEKGVSYEYQIIALDEWQINTVTFNGIDVTNQITDNLFTTPVITDNAELAVVFKSMSDGINYKGIDSNIKVYASGNNITIKGADRDAKVSIFDTNGRQIKAATGNTTLSIANGGIYIVKVGNETFKVSL